MVSGQKLDSAFTLEQNVGVLVDTWTKAMDVTNQNLFDGSDASVKELWGQISDGKVLEAGYALDEVFVQNTVEKAIYAWLTPQAWMMGNEGYHPVVVCVSSLTHFPLFPQPSHPKKSKWKEGADDRIATPVPHAPSSTPSIQNI